MMLGRVLQLVMLAMVAVMMTGGAHVWPKMDAPKGYALLIGVNRLDPNAWGGWRGQLRNCHKDVSAIAEMLAARGFAAEQLLDSEATTTAVRESTRRIGRAANNGDIVVVYFSGYGSQLLDGNGDEEDRLDDTWCLYDGHLLDDQLMDALSTFRSGVRIVVIADCSHSATSVRLAAEDFESLEKAAAKMKAENQVMVDLDLAEQELTEKDLLNAFQDLRLSRTTRGLAVGQAIGAYRSRQSHYDNLAANAPERQQQTILADALFITACRPDETAAESDTLGLFTQMLVYAWSSGKFESYQALFDEVAKRTNQKRRIMSQGRFTQQPSMVQLGPVDEAFRRNQPPFSIELPQQSTPSNDPEVRQ